MRSSQRLPRERYRQSIGSARARCRGNAFSYRRWWLPDLRSLPVLPWECSCFSVQRRLLFPSTTRSPSAAALSTPRVLLPMGRQSFTALLGKGSHSNFSRLGRRALSRRSWDRREPTFWPSPLRAKWRFRLEVTPERNSFTLARSRGYPWSAALRARSGKTSNGPIGLPTETL